MTEKICKICGKVFKSRKDLDLCVHCRKNTNASCERTCEHCGATFFGSPDTIYCRRCRNKWVAAKAPTIKCTVCENEFKSLYGEKICTNCRHERRINSLLENQKCQLCGKIFKATYRSQILCDTCKSISGRIQSTCIVCGKEFLPKKRNTKCKTCSRHCQSLYVQNSGQGIKYSDEYLKDKLIECLKDGSLPPSLELLCKDLGVTRKVLTARGISVLDAAKIAGINITDWQPYLASAFELFIYNTLREIAPEAEIVTQKTFEGLIGNKAPLRFDFYLPSYNLLVEADGTQHYQLDNSLHTELLENYDFKKNIYARDNNINLLRIRYNVLKNYTKQTKQLLCKILPQCQETGTANLFNCWDGSELLPISISSEACSTEQERSTTSPQGRSLESGETGGTLT